jgi:cobyrinic acid a,c-diamide synthase
MAGVFPGKASRQEKLVRFGYLELLPEDDSLLFQKGETVPAHEFHYWDSTCCGTDLIARKRSKNKTWRCGYATPGLYAAFPHLYLDQKKAERFVRACTNLS